jgi:UDP-N-acetylmuramyl pentapeptide phosphotransferase/UDP-N-acetylglucosamine-1-phosphate transferase
MINSSINLSFLSIFSMLSFFIFLIIQKNFNKKNNALLDNDFKKPQAFHNYAVPRSGGLAALVSLVLFFVLYYFFFDKTFLDYLVISVSIFVVGFLDDVKFNISASIRLMLMILVILFSVIFFSIQLESLDLNFIEKLLSNSFLNIVFISLCFLFIINGSNLIDGFNGLITIHLLIINFILLIINMNSLNNELIIFISAQVIVLLSFLMFNFPKAKMFLGDGGSYMFGTLTAMNVIKTNNFNPEISSFFFCVLLFYLFFEVFFSFFRKIFLKKSPLKPDSYHLHMLTFKWLKNLRKFQDRNYLNSLVLNTIYLLAILPAIYFKNNGIFCRYWFFALLVSYIFFYSRLYSFAKK